MSIFNCNIEYETLQDVKNGKSVKWRAHKKKSLILSGVYGRLEMYRKQKRVLDCGTFLEFKEFKDGEKKLNHANFCKVRLCPMCAWRRSLKIFGQASQIMDYIEEHHDYKYIFATFTVKNVTGDLLTDELDKLFKGFNLMTKRKEFKALSKGWFRCLEVTHNWGRNDYHPHFHMVIAVNKSYGADPKNYLTHGKWVTLWRSCLNLDYDPILDVRMVKPNEDGTFGKVVAEVAKYAAKPEAYIIDRYNIPFLDDDSVVSYVDEREEQAVKFMDDALKGRRLIAYGGLFREVYRKLDLDDAIDGDLINTDISDEIRNDLNYIIVRYSWNVGISDYVKILEDNEDGD